MDLQTVISHWLRPPARMNSHIACTAARALSPYFFIPKGLSMKKLVRPYYSAPHNGTQAIHTSQCLTRWSFRHRLAFIAVPYLAPYRFLLGNLQRRRLWKDAGSICPVGHCAHRSTFGLCASLTHSVSVVLFVGLGECIYPLKWPVQD